MFTTRLVEIENIFYHEKKWLILARRLFQTRVPFTARKTAQAKFLAYLVLCVSNHEPSAIENSYGLPMCCPTTGNSVKNKLFCSKGFISKDCC